MFKDMFNTLLTDILTPCLQHTGRHVDLVLEDMFMVYLEACLNKVGRHVYSMFVQMFTLFLKTGFIMFEFTHKVYLKPFLYNICKHVYTIFQDKLEDMFTPSFTLP